MWYMRVDLRQKRSRMSPVRPTSSSDITRVDLKQKRTRMDPSTPDQQQ
jgi:hypothetical protein